MDNFFKTSEGHILRPNVGLLASLFMVFIVALTGCGVSEPDVKNPKGSITIHAPDTLSLEKAAESIHRIQCIVQKGTNTVHDREYVKGDSGFIIEIEDLDPSDDYSVLLLGQNSESETVARGYEQDIEVTAGKNVQVYLSWIRIMIVADIDGNVYQAVKIGNRWWMMENLKVTRYRNGDPIEHITDAPAWDRLTVGAFCMYDNSADNGAVYGFLYNWYAVNDSRGITPEGWHVPTDEEWQTLIDHLGGASIAGGKMKEAGLSHWENPNTGADNESGFLALPGGYRYYEGDFHEKGYQAYFWSGTGISLSLAWNRVLRYNSSAVDRVDRNRIGGFSVRCVRDE